MPRLSQMTTAEFKASLSIAGNPDKIMAIMEEVHKVITNKLDIHNLAEIDNMIDAVKRVKAELKTWRKIEYKRQHPKIK